MKIYKNSTPGLTLLKIRIELRVIINLKMSDRVFKCDTYLRTNLVSALADLQMHNFSHFELFLIDSLTNSSFFFHWLFFVVPNLFYFSLFHLYELLFRFEFDPKEEKNNVKKFKKSHVTVN